jgi:hypothetical protein
MSELGNRKKRDPENSEGTFKTTFNTFKEITEGSILFYKGFVSILISEHKASNFFLGHLIKKPKIKRPKLFDPKQRA